MSSGRNGLGQISFWGFSPAKNFFEFSGLKSLLREDERGDGDELTTSTSDEPINILLVGASDLRHVMKTVSKSRGKRRINFYMLENNLEVYAREMLFLAIFLENPSRLGLQEKVEILLELYGNTFIRYTSYAYMLKMCDVFIKCVTDESYLSSTLPVLNLSMLKYKERDQLEGVFKFWRNPDTSLFKIDQLWDARVRHHLGTRYDARKGVFDWDLSMSLSERGAAIIGNRKYCHWRETGVAFGLRDGTYDKPNRTLASGLVVMRGGEEVLQRGYFGDIVVSPFIALGVESENESLFKKNNHEFIKNGEDVAWYNMTSILHEFTHGLPYKELAKESAVSDGAKTESATIEEIIEEEEEEDDTNKEEPTNTSNTQELPSVEIRSSGDHAETAYEGMPEEQAFSLTFLSLNSFNALKNKGKFRGKMDAVYFSSSMIHLWTPDVKDLLRGPGTVIAETARFIPELKLDNLKAYNEKVSKMATDCGCETVSQQIDPLATSFLEFRCHG